MKAKVHLFIYTILGLLFAGSFLKVSFAIQSAFAFGLVVLILIIVLIYKNIVLYKKLKHEAALNEINDILKNEQIDALQNILTRQNQNIAQFSAKIHDEIGGFLSTIKHHFSFLYQKIDFAETHTQHEFEKGQVLLNQLISYLRDCSLGIEGDVLESFDLAAMLQSFSKKISELYAIKIEINQEEFEVRSSQLSKKQGVFEIYNLIQNILITCISTGYISQISLRTPDEDKHTYSLNFYVKHQLPISDTHQKEIKKLVENSHGILTSNYQQNETVLSIVLSTTT